MKQLYKIHLAAVVTAALLLAAYGLTADANEGITGVSPPITFECIQNQAVYHPGDQVTLSLLIGNEDSRDYSAELFVILYMDGNFWFWPAWTSYIDWMPMHLPAGFQTNYVIMDFPSPMDTGEYSIVFWAVLWVERTWFYWCDFNVTGSE
jgi:hypothetical protein